MDAKALVFRTNTCTTVWLDVVQDVSGLPPIAAPVQQNQNQEAVRRCVALTGRGTAAMGVQVRVAHDAFLVDYMLALGERHGLPLFRLYGPRCAAKEMTEAGAALYYSTRCFRAARGDRIRCYVIGEGRAPRVSLPLRRARPGWDIVSIDPVVTRDGVIDGVRYIADLDHNVDLSSVAARFDAVVVLGVHSHNDMRAFVARLEGVRKALVVAIPCCKPVEVPDPTHDFQCPGIFSACNRVLIYNRGFAQTSLRVPDPRWSVEDTSQRPTRGGEGGWRARQKAASGLVKHLRPRSRAWAARTRRPSSQRDT